MPYSLLESEVVYMVMDVHRHPGLALAAEWMANVT